MSRPAKRQRTKRSGRAYHDPIPIADEFSIVHAREGRLRRVGNNTVTAATSRVSTHVSGSLDAVESWSPPDDPNYALENDGEWYDEAVEAPILEEPRVIQLEVPKKKKKSLVAVRLDVLLHKTVQLIPFPELVCQDCCVKRHRLEPFHHIQQWDGSKFGRVSLKSLGLKLLLNHAGSRCDNPVPCHASLLVLHTNGIHEVNLEYCGCTRAIPQHLQLLRRRLYPASQITVKCCATFELLALLHKFALTTKSSTYDFYRALEKMTSNTAIHPPKSLMNDKSIGPWLPKSRYRALFRMIMQWRHLKMLKWAGRGHDIMGVDGTKDGELAVRCPSCPTPGINLPEGWESAPDDAKFLYAAIICMDANFRLKNQIVSNYSQDPGLGTGWAYLVPRVPYENYVLSRANDADISTCVGFQALAKANTKFSVGLRYTGVGMTTCGRSEMIMPCGVGNLQKGERYANMDYIFASTIRNLLLPLVVISYDIACQWFINIFRRMDEHWPKDLKIPPTTKLIPAIPKLHEPMHQSTNHQVYSLNFISGVGQTDCECPERVWGPHNCLGNSTKTQGPGSRQDVLDDHFGFWNWVKVVNIGLTLLRKYKSAVAERNIQVEAHRGLTEAVGIDVVRGWEVMCEQWERDDFPKTKRNPYHNSDAYLSEAAVKKRLAEEEKQRVDSGGISLHSTSAWSFVSLGLDLEDIHRIRAWEQVLPIYMPGIVQYKADLLSQQPVTPAPKSIHPEDEDLWLPSKIGCPTRRQAISVDGLSSIEESLRDAQLQDALEAVRRILRLKSRMILFKNRNIRGQRDGTKSNAMIDRVHDRARAAVEKYREARTAKLALAGSGNWQNTYRALLDSDVRAYQDPNQLRERTGRRGVFEDDQVDALQEQPPASTGSGETIDDRNFLFNQTRTKRDGTGETRRTLSWIWLTSTGTGQDKDDNAGDETMRVEWAKSRARALRAKEEVLLLKEEMRRVLVYVEWKEKWWLQRLSPRPSTPRDLEEGVRGYALYQADIQKSFRILFRKLWELPLQDDVSPTDGMAEGDSDDDTDEEIERDNEMQDEDDDEDM
ncbi:hypothetical protein CPC08DRAFT_649982 [Agrocybe pediades]|nr:hypothetical protein CPC08DRAFT_649982 [Agrocybe pediades]